VGSAYPNRILFARFFFSFVCHTLHTVTDDDDDDEADPMIVFSLENFAPALALTPE
jgi:hypothetical protein